MATKPLKSLKFPTLDDTYTVPQVDDTLAVQGAAADAKKVGDELTDLKEDLTQLESDVDGVETAVFAKVNKPLTSPNGTAGQLLRSLGNGNTEWSDVGAPTDEQVQTFIDDWLDDHPEATTTVQDGSITKAKLVEALQYKVNNFHTYYAELDRWQIKNDGTDAETTTANINSMLVWAKNNGFNAVALPSGTYLIAAYDKTKPGWDRRYAGVLMPGNMALLMGDDVTLQVETNGSKAYTCIYIGPDMDNTIIKGGHIIGDRATHDFNGDPTSTAHEWGHGIFSRGCENLIIDGVQLEGFTGDAIAMSCDGNTYDPETPYNPTENVKIINCTIKNSRRNNISITGAQNVTIAGCHIIGAGTADENHDGTAPRAGIDVEGEGSGSTDFSITKQIFVIGNLFEGNLGTACDFLTGYECFAIGNKSDGAISYGYGNNIVISDNVFYRGEGLSRAKTAISSNNISSGFDGNYTVISGNSINGFNTGLDIRGSHILAVGNNIANVNIGIGMYNCAGCAILSNTIEDFLQEAGSSAIVTAIKIDISSNVILKSNKIRNGGNYSIIVSSNSSVSPTSKIIIDGNVFYDILDGVYIEKVTDLLLKGNVFKNVRDAVLINASASDVTIENNNFEKASRTGIRGTLGNATENKLSIFGNTFRIADENAIYFTKVMYLDVIGNLFICSPTTNNNRDAIYVVSTPNEGAIMNRFIENVVCSVVANNMRYAMTVPNGGSQFIGNRIYTGTINHHVDDTMINNYPAA